MRLWYAAPLVFALVYVVMKIEPLTWDSVIAVALAVLFAFPGLWIWAKSHWGKFGLRFLDPEGAIDPKEERQSRVLRLLPGKVVVRFALRPQIAISMVTRFNFSFFDNDWYPRRLWMSSTGKRILTSRIVATRIRYHQGGKNWRNWQAIPRPEPEEKGAGWDTSIGFTTGSRQVFEVEFEVGASMLGWDGILGVEVTYEASGNNDHAYVNSKVFVAGMNCTPLTFKLRRINTCKLSTQSIPGTAGSPLQ